MLVRVAEVDWFSFGFSNPAFEFSQLLVFLWVACGLFSGGAPLKRSVVNVLSSVFWHTYVGLPRVLPWDRPLSRGQVPFRSVAGPGCHPA